MHKKDLTWDEFTPEKAETIGDVQGRMVDFFKTMCQSIYDKNIIYYFVTLPSYETNETAMHVVEQVSTTRKYIITL